MTLFNPFTGPHLCYALRCSTLLPQEMFMCGAHWNMLPAEIRRRIVRHYRTAERGEKAVTQEWQADAKDAQGAVEKRGFEACFRDHGVGCGCWSGAKKEAPASK